MNRPGFLASTCTSSDGRLQFAESMMLAMDGVERMTTLQRIADAAARHPPELRRLRLRRHHRRRTQPVRPPPDHHRRLPGLPRHRHPHQLS
ncbi:hypothetical protein FHS39_003192 [Streptomyces olivoverticillatus]|uniref:Uncharacterized protein n=1 Tax=Streptomyces olivoverticillatus TaxID=66427 RepID=A0A7W7LPP7_9ACTN|nr:hypothetical protein [Streptomyces olivoverticillatus]MBB4894158.1 hypothetical protein [Streptomyces olivoverticillatus]